MRGYARRALSTSAGRGSSPALEKRDAESEIKRVLKKGNVLIEELLLEVLRVRRDDDTLAAHHGEVRRRNQICQRLPDSRPRLANEIDAAVE